MSEYIENTWEEFGVEHRWKDASIVDSTITYKGTLVEMVDRPKWGLACYMDNAIQSCEVDEYLYHESLVHPVMLSVENCKRVMIIGGGEGATAREVLQWPVEQVDMYEWDKDVVQMFKDYPQWAKGAWDDERLTVYYENIFDVIEKRPHQPYDVIIVDLFEPCEENKEGWYKLIHNMKQWITAEGSIVIYAGIRNFLIKQPYCMVCDMITKSKLKNREIIPYHVFIPSFSGESVFLLVKNKASEIDFDFMKDKKIISHITNRIWNSYTIFNW